jgi:hypothetical protein
MRDRTPCLALLLALGGCSDDSVAPSDAAAPPDAPAAPVWTEAFPAVDFGWLLVAPVYAVRGNIDGPTSPTSSPSTSFTTAPGSCGSCSCTSR